MNVVGVLLMRATLGVLVSIAPTGIPRLADVGLDAPAFVFAIVVAVGTGLLFGLIPATVALRGSLSKQTLKVPRRLKNARFGRIYLWLVD